MKKILLSMALACFGLSSNSFAQTIAVTQNFEGITIPALPTGWTMTHTGGGGWVTTSGPTSWANVGATIPAHSQYAIVNDYANPNNNPAMLTTPSFSLSSVTSPYLVYDWFYVQAYNATAAEQAWIQISTDGGTTYNFLDSINYNTTAGWGTKFIDLSAVTATGTCMIQFCYRDNGQNLCGLALDNIMIYGNATNFIGLTAVTPALGSINDYFLVGSPATFGGVIENFGSTAITSFTANYQVGTSAPVTGITVSASVPAWGSSTFSIPTPYTVASVTAEPVKIWISGTGVDVATPALDTENTDVVGYGFLPLKKELFEEATGTWCGYCVRGIVYMDSLWKNDSSSVSIISVHDADPMSQENTTTSNYDTWISSNIGGYPDMVIDRRYVDDPSNALIDHTNDAGLFGFANLTLSVGTTKEGFVNASVQVKPAMNLSGSYQLQLDIEEMLVHGTEDGTATGTTTGYYQHDYYGINGSAHSLPTLSGCGYDFTDTVVVASTQAMLTPSLYFPFVARYSVPDMSAGHTNGVAGSLPATMTEGSVYTYTFAPVAINTVTTTSTGGLPWVANNLRVIVMLIDNNPTSATYGQVLNTDNMRTPYWYPAGVANVNSGIEGMTVFPNPSSQDAHVKFGLSEDGNVQLSVYDAVGREVFTVPSQQMSAGGQQINFSTASFASGVYNVVLRSDNGTETQRLSVVNN